MANQTIPITLTAGPVPPGFQAANIDQLLAAVATYIAGAIRADVSFYLEVLFDPTSYVTNLIFNSTQQVWKYWDSTTGTYVPIQTFPLGMVTETFVGTDQLSIGWVILNGRALTAIPGLTTAQLSVLQSFFGAAPGTLLPNLTVANLGALPGAATFSDIPDVVVEPADGVIGALPVGGSYDASEISGIRDATETLRDSVEEVENEVSGVKDACDDLLTALRTPLNPPLYSMMFIGYS